MIKLSVMQVSGSLDPKLGGPSTVIGSLTKYLGQRYSLTNVVVGVNKSSLSTNLNPKTLLNNRYGIFLSFDVIKIINKIRKVEVVLCHGFYLGTTLLALISFPRKILIAPHGSLEEYQWSNSRIAKKIFDWIYLFCSKFTTVEFIVATEAEMRSLRKKFWKTKITIVGLGIDAPLFDFKSKLNKDSSLILLSLSRITAIKRIDNSIRAISILNSLSQTYSLVVAGEGDVNLLNELKTLASSGSDGQWIIFKNWVREDQLDELFDEVDMLLLPSENENFAIAVAQSIVRGVPVVVSSNVALSSFVREKHCGIVIDDISPKSIAAAVQVVQADLHEYSLNCLKASKELLWDEVIMRWYEVIERK